MYCLKATWKPSGLKTQTDVMRSSYVHALIYSKKKPLHSRTQLTKFVKVKVMKQSFVSENGFSEIPWGINNWISQEQKLKKQDQCEWVKVERQPKWSTLPKICETGNAPT